jgi:hypothetical protein
VLGNAAMPKCLRFYSIYNLVRSVVLVATLVYVVGRHDQVLAEQQTRLQASSSSSRCLQCYEQAVRATSSPPYFDLDACMPTLFKIRPALNLSVEALPHAQLVTQLDFGFFSSAARAQWPSLLAGAIVLFVFWAILTFLSPMKKRRARVRSGGDVLGLFLAIEIVIALSAALFVCYSSAHALGFFIAQTPDIEVPEVEFYADGGSSRRAVESTHGSALLALPDEAPHKTGPPVAGAGTSLTSMSANSAARVHSHFSSVVSSALSLSSSAAQTHSQPVLLGSLGPCAFVALSPEFAFVEWIGAGVALISLVVLALIYSWLSQYEIFMLLMATPIVVLFIFFGESCIVFAVSHQTIALALPLISIAAIIEVYLVHAWLYDLLAPSCDSDYLAPI